MGVIVCHSKAEWEEQHSKAGDKVVIVDFSATWCGPCRMISPAFEKMSEQIQDVVFLQVDVDEVQEVAAECGISAMPTFQVFKGGKKIGEMVGANKDKLVEMIMQYTNTKVAA